MTPTPPSPPSNVVQMPKALGKTQQRVTSVLKVLRDSPRQAFAYADLQELTGTPYDQLLYMLHAWAEVGVVKRSEVANGPGRPKVTFQWSGARASGARAASVR